jgi:nucleotide-binding universal stress UspA family protein
MSDQNARPVVYGYDGSEDANRALQEGSQLFTGRPSVVVCVWQSVWKTVMAPPFAGLPSDVVEQADQAAAARARELAEEGAERISGPAEPRAVKGLGSVWGTILDLADAVDASVIVVGSRGLGGLRSTILGSVSHGLVHHSHRPVLVVAPKADA